MNALTLPPWKQPIARLEAHPSEGHSSIMSPDEMQTLLQAHNKGKDTDTVLKVKGLCGGVEAVNVPAGSKNVVSLSNNKVFIVYGHDIECREQLELLLRRMKLEPVILQNLPIAGDTIIEKLEANIDVRYACVLLTPDDEGHPVNEPKEKK